MFPSYKKAREDRGGDMLLGAERGRQEGTSIVLYSKSVVIEQEIPSN